MTGGSPPGASSAGTGRRCARSSRLAPGRPRGDHGRMSSVGPVVVGYDGSPSATSAVRWAAREARRRSTRLDVVFARDAHDTHLEPSLPGGGENAQAGARALAERGRGKALEVEPDVEVEASL